MGNEQPGVLGQYNELNGYAWPPEFQGPPLFDLQGAENSLNRSVPCESKAQFFDAIPQSVEEDISDTKRCPYPGCPETRDFKQNSAFKKHMDKHTRPYKCTISGCTVKDFSNLGDPRRHRREVHSSPSFICPVVTCNRHRRGFGRRDNLTQHLKRTHAVDPTGAVLASNSIGDGKGEIITTPNDESSMASENERSAADEVDIMGSEPSDKMSLIAKLRELQASKEKSMTKFDDDIAALKRVISFM